MTQNLEGRQNLTGEFKGTDENSHLGGCGIGGDAGTYYPHMWKALLEKFEIKSVIDVGCGPGWALKFFKENGCNSVLGVEGLQEAIDGSPLKENIQQHDYEKSGPFVPSEKFDLCWSCEFVEHVEESCADNFIETFKSAKYLAMTFAGPGQGGHHHVNCQPHQYWVEKLANHGFRFDLITTQYLISQTKLDEQEWKDMGEPWHACFHFAVRGLFFVNEN
jgi:SAM-dependent methyltransferase